MNAYVSKLERLLLTIADEDELTRWRKEEIATTIMDGNADRVQERERKCHNVTEANGSAK